MKELKWMGFKSEEAEIEEEKERRGRWRHVFFMSELVGLGMYVQT